MQMGIVDPDGFMSIPYALFEYLQKYGGDAMCSNTTYAKWAEGFEKIYQKHKNDPLMKGQTWYPKKVEKYKKLQKDFEERKAVDPVYKYFPNHKRK